MKKMLLALMFAAAPAAALPDVVTYSARVENDAGPFNGTASIAFQLFDAATAGSELWTESVASIVVVDGDLVHDLGSVEPLDDSVIERDDLFLAVTINGDALEPRVAIRAVPYALKAREAESLGGLSSSDVATDVEVAAAVAGRVVDFSQLTGVPVGFADSVDNDTIATAAAGGGLSVVSGAFSIANDGVTLARLADSSVGSAEVVNETLTSLDLASGAVGNSELGTDAVTSAKIAVGAVTASDVLDGTLTKLDVARLALVQAPVDCNSQLIIDDNEDGTASCRSVMCGVSAGLPLFFDCGGTCDAPTSRSCSFSRNLAGFLLQP